MARPRENELTQRELELMQIFWDDGEQTVAEVQKKLAENGRDLAYTTVATLVKILLEKGFVRQTNDSRPFVYRPSRSFEDVSGSIVGDLIQRVFGGSREQLLIRMMKQRKLTSKERQLLQDILEQTNE